MKITFTIILTFFLSVMFNARQARSQHSSVSRYVSLGAAPLIHNSGFAGEAGVSRISAYSYLSHDRGSWPTTMANLLMYDAFHKKTRSGFAVVTGRVGSRSFGKFAVSPKISLKGKYTIAPFADFTMQVVEENSWKYQSSVGFLLNTSSAYFGLSTALYSSGVDYLDFEPAGSLFFQGGYSWEPKNNRGFSITPQVAVGYVKKNLSERNFQLIDVSLMFRKQKFAWGMNTTSGITVGYQTTRIRVLVAQWLNNSEYIGSVSLRYLFRPDRSQNEILRMQQL